MEPSRYTAARTGRWTKSRAAKGLKTIHRPPRDFVTLSKMAAPKQVAWGRPSACGGLSGRLGAMIFIPADEVLLMTRLSPNWPNGHFHRWLLIIRNSREFPNCGIANRTGWQAGHTIAYRCPGST
jgi:hypothetical protein